MTDLSNAPLGNESQYPSKYDASVLFPISRSESRNELGISGATYFSGYDNWTAFELSWLNPKGKPCVVVAHFSFDCASTNIVESKSLKLYLNSFNQTTFSDMDVVVQTIERDLSKACAGSVNVRLQSLDEAYDQLAPWPNECIDDLDVEISEYLPNPSLLNVSDTLVGEQLQTHLFRSLCPVTAQPDWASVRIEYHGRQIDRASLLSYLVSYRNHQGFHEQCVEQIFKDIVETANPDSLLVEARFLRRGGLDINPVRMKGLFEVNSQRLSRQ